LSFASSALTRCRSTGDEPYFAIKSEQPRDPDVGFCGHAKERNEELLLDRAVNPRAQILLGEAPLIEELLHQRVVALRDQLHQLAVQLPDAFLPCALRRLLLELPAPARLVADDVTPEHIENLIEAGPRIHRHIQRKHAMTVMSARVREHLVEMCVGFIHRIDDEHLWNPAIERAIPDPLGAHADPVLRVHDHEREVRHAQRRQRLAQEIEVPRAYR
jgi:hypothetical protein